MSRAHDIPNSPRPADLLVWYDRNRRRMPWRADPGTTPDPYHVWLSEIMLQQTTVATVGPYFERFVARWSDMRSLAEAPLDDVLHAWQGLGYYARARNLHRCAIEVVRDHGGRLPDTESALLKLPGIGRYTAAAIAAIAFGRKATVVDGNVERVMARLFAVTTPLPDAKPELYAVADGLTPESRPGDYAQAVMDLGATICTPRSPRCLLCPWSDCCAGRAKAAELPRRKPKKKRPLRHGTAFWITRDDGAVLLRRRPEKGLLGGMMEIPTTPWREEKPFSDTDARQQAPLAATNWSVLPGTVEHGFTHFRLELRILAGRVAAGTQPSAQWSRIEELPDQALPTLMKKVVAHALAATGAAHPSV